MSSKIYKNVKKAKALEFNTPQIEVPKYLAIENTNPKAKKKFRLVKTLSSKNNLNSINKMNSITLIPTDNLKKLKVLTSGTPIFTTASIPKIRKSYTKKKI